MRKNLPLAFLLLFCQIGFSADSRTYTELSGIDLKAASCALHRFEADFKDYKLDNYTIFILDKGKNIEVVFLPKFPAGKSFPGGSTPYGREIHMLVSKKNFTVDEIRFAR